MKREKDLINELKVIAKDSKKRLQKKGVNESDFLKIVVKSRGK